MAFAKPPASSDGSHGILQPLSSAVPALSSNRPFKKHISVPLEIVSEIADETNAGSFVSEATDQYSICTSPTCTKGSSSDEGAKLLVQPFGSSEKVLVYGNGGKGSAGIRAGSSTIQAQINHHPASKAAAEKTARVKVSFREEAEAESCVAAGATKKSGTQIHRQRMEVPATEAAAAARRSRNISRTGNHGKPSFAADALQPEPCASPYPALHSNIPCLPSLSGRAAGFLQKRCSHAVHKLRSFIRQQRQASEMSEDEGDLIHRLPGTSMDDVNEMKALLNTINQNLKMLETRSKAHPQLLSSKLAPVYFTT